MQAFRRTSATQSEQRRAGAALVELAFALPIFVAVTLGIVEFGRAMMVGQLITNAAREGARLGIIDGTTNTAVVNEIKTFLQQSANVAPGDVNVVITITPATGNPDPAGQLAASSARDLIQVRIEVPFNKVSFVPGNYLQNKTLVGVAAMRHE